MIFFILQRLRMIAHFLASDLPLIECILSIFKHFHSSTSLQSQTRRINALSIKFSVLISLYIVNLLVFISLNEKVDYTSHKPIVQKI